MYFLQALAEMGEENAFVMDSVLEAGDLSWGSPHFFAMVISYSEICHSLQNLSKIIENTTQRSFHAHALQIHIFVAGHFIILSSICAFLARYN